MTGTHHPLRNRVTPDGDIVAVPERGLFFGNRGVLHDEERNVRRAWQVRRWITCRLRFRGRRRALLQPRRYTELFFLDEATALAAGHRPCAECRYHDYQRYRSAWAAALGGGPLPADDLDRVLHAERVTAERTKRVHETPAADLPDGAMARLDGASWLVVGGELLAWTPGGYAERRSRPGRGVVTVLTPPSSVAVLRAGYEPVLHPTAAQSREMPAS
ncbi:MAG TPA: hypothetical protein VFA92_13255 [Candidatus Binatia bacterium]|jgi:hypothetical protein|nr:hypothetical protein [Candidatus Binatia bacterium]